MFAKLAGLMSTDMAIDLGTANTLVYVKEAGIVLNEPSVVAVERGSRRILGIGLEAKRMLGRTPEGIEAIRPLKDGVIADVDVTEMMLRHFLKQVTSKRIFRIKPTVVVGVPSGITELERRAVRSSAMSAGSKNVFMVDEPMAAAIGVGLPYAVGAAIACPDRPVMVLQGRLRPRSPRPGLRCTMPFIGISSKRTNC